MLNAGARLLISIGPRGVGKTRLALAVAEGIEEHDAHGSVFVDLCPLRDPNLVLDATAQAFGLRQARLGLVAYLGRQWSRAAAYCRESLARSQEVGDSASLGQIAALALACGLDRRHVARPGSAVQHRHRALGLPSPPVELDHHHSAAYLP